MQIITDFTTIPDEYGKQAPEENKVDGSTVVSFPFGVRGVDPAMRYLHWAFTDDGSIPVCGFQWIHWSLANLPIGAVMFDPDAPDTLLIPADFSRSVVSMVPEAVQGRNSQDSRLVGVTDPQVAQRYTGPKPPNEDHEYLLRVWATREPVAGLDQGFRLNRLYDGLRALGASADLSSGDGMQCAAVLLRGRC
ncbi:MAG: YbhB/YbcL family Raf kinase inhibitor-like protein [Aeriscardovia sp.]|nr:YbhB/YbcL family Raf kinase inhibitor-like protein [Aeriscardovia sp.]